MIEFLTILLFAKTIALMPSPVDLTGRHVFSAHEDLEALTSGASIEIDVSKLIASSAKRPLDIIDTPNQLRRQLPLGSVKVELVSPTGEVLQLEDAGFTISRDSARLIFSAPRRMPTKVTWRSVAIESQATIPRAQIFWKNARL